MDEKDQITYHNVPRLKIHLFHNSFPYNTTGTLPTELTVYCWTCFDFLELIFSSDLVQKINIPVFQCILNISEYHIFKKGKFLPFSGHLQQLVDFPEDEQSTL